MTTHDNPASVKPVRWYVETPIRLPDAGRLWREWRCSRRHSHGPEGFYPPAIIKESDGWRLWMQECQECGRFTVWSERSLPLSKYQTERLNAR